MTLEQRLSEGYMQNLKAKLGFEEKVKWLLDEMRARAAIKGDDIVPNVKKVEEQYLWGYE